MIAQVKQLEDVDESAKDWHPYTNDQVLDLVHPSLFFIVYGRTNAYHDTRGDLTTEPLAAFVAPVDNPLGRAAFVSSNFCWLPTEFSVSLDGHKTTALGYINNIHPEKKETYHVVERCLSAFIPMFERVLTDAHRMNPLPTRITGGYEYSEDYDPENPLESHIVVADVDPDGYQHLSGIEQRVHAVSLKGTTIKVIVKLANIHLVSPYTFRSFYISFYCVFTDP